MALKIKAGGSWLPAKAVRLRVSGTWTAAKIVRQRIAGVWTVIWSALEITCSNFIGVSGANATRTISTVGGTAPFTVTAVTIFPTTGPVLAWSASGLSVTLLYQGEDSEGAVTLFVTDANGSVAKVETTYSLTAPL